MNKLLRVYARHCPKCGVVYLPGQTGQADGCDRCLGIERDAQGIPWRPGETIKTLIDIATGQCRTLDRADAFARSYSQPRG